MSEDGGAIIIKGGSVHLSFDGTLYQKVSGDPTTHKHEERKITRVLVEDEKGKSRYDSGAEIDDGLEWTITVSTK